jgi:hypothetical protein
MPYADGLLEVRTEYTHGQLYTHTQGSPDEMFAGKIIHACMLLIS